MTSHNVKVASPLDEDVVIIRGSEVISSLAVEQAVMTACASDGKLGVEAVMAFAVPHEQHGQAVGVAVVGHTSHTITIAQLRQCTARAGLVPKRWLPELLVLVKALPATRDGLAESLKLNGVKDKHGMRNVDLRKPAPSHEVAKRAAARSAAAKRASTQKPNAAVGGGDQSDATSTARLVAALKQGGSTCSVRGCVALVVLAMSEVCGSEVSEEDNLFEAGLTSITAAKLRTALAEAIGVAIPPDLLLVHAGVSSLGGAIYRMWCAAGEARAASTAEVGAEGEEGSGAEGGGGGGGSGAEEELMPLLLADAAERMRAGDLDAAEATCLRGAAAAGLPAAVEWWQHAPIRVAAASGTTTAEVAPRGDGAAGATGAEHTAPTPTPKRTAVPLLATLTAVWRRQGRPREAAAALALLLGLRAHGAGTGSGPRARGVGLDTALLRMELARLQLALGDAASAAASVATADTDADAADAVVSPADSASCTGTSGVACVHGAAAGVPGCVKALLLDATARPEVVLEVVPEVGLASTPEWCVQCVRVVQVLELRRRGMVALPGCVGSLAALRVLDVSENRLESLPESICMLSQLRELLAASNELRRLPTRLSELPHLNVVNIQGNRFASLPKELLRCRRLHYLRWGAQKVAADAAGSATGGDGDGRTAEMPNGVAAAGTAGAATLRLPAWLKCLQPCLAHLAPGTKGAPGGAATEEEAKGEAKEAEAEEVAEMVDEPFAADTLAVLELEANGQTSLPPLHPRNTVLVALLASFNQLGAAPPQLARYGASLKKLHLGCNGISTASVAAVLPSLTRLTELCLEGNQLHELPASIGELRSLRELWLHGNQLAALPAELGKCASLTVLQAHHNLLRDLPDALGRLSKLQGLYLQSNKLEGLAALHERVFSLLPLQNLALGQNELDLAEAFEWPGVRLGLGWNRGAPPPPLRGLLTDRFATIDHLFDPACSGGTRSDVLLVAFSAQGPGIQQWQAAAVAPLRALGTSLDALYLADPSNSYYLQDPGCGWGGIAHFSELIRRHAQHYERVLMVGSSMGGCAALMHAHHAHEVLAFGPRVDLERTHGSYVPDAAKRACASSVHASLRTMRGRATVHVGSGNAVDVMQAGLVRGVGGLEVREHDTFHHNVPMFLEREGQLVPLIKRSLLRLLRPQENDGPPLGGLGGAEP